MHPRVIRQREQSANAESSELAKSIAEKTGADASALSAAHREPAMASMLQAEAMRDFLKDLDAALGGGPAATDLESIEGIGPELASELRASGYQTLDDLREAGDSELLKVEGIGKASLKKIRTQL